MLKIANGGGTRKSIAAKLQLSETDKENIPTLEVSRGLSGTLEALQTYLTLAVGGDTLIPHLEINQEVVLGLIESLPNHLIGELVDEILGGLFGA